MCDTWDSSSAGWSDEYLEAAFVRLRSVVSHHSSPRIQWAYVSPKSPQLCHDDSSYGIQASTQGELWWAGQMVVNALKSVGSCTSTRSRTLISSSRCMVSTSIQHVTRLLTCLSTCICLQVNCDVEEGHHIAIHIRRGDSCMCVFQSFMDDAN